MLGAESRSLAGGLTGLLIWSVLFPFIPSLARSSDTQPTFLLVFLVALVIGFALPPVASQMFQFSFSGIVATAATLLVLYTLLLLANLLESGSTIVSRLFAFLQFGAAGLWAYTGKHRWNRNMLYRVLVIYLVFTGIYFATGGAIENVLIHSRAAGSASLFESGRGARTLSPEPSFFALQVFNIYILGRLVERRTDTGGYTASRIVLLVVCCLLSTFSVYGALIALLILCAEYARAAATAALVLLSATSVAYAYLVHLQSFRAVGFLLAFLDSRGSIAKLYLLDSSLASRIASFDAYASSFGEHPWVGDGFSLFQGGGFVSVVAGFGIAALLFFMWSVAKLVTVPYSGRTRILLVVWFALNFISGPIGVPIVGVIFGTALAAGRPLLRLRARPALTPHHVLLT